jgi:hypothetical protein
VYPVVGGLAYPVVERPQAELFLAYPAVGGLAYPVVGGLAYPVVGGLAYPVVGGLAYPVVESPPADLILAYPAVATIPTLARYARCRDDGRRGEKTEESKNWLRKNTRRKPPPLIRTKPPGEISKYQGAYPAEQRRAQPPSPSTHRGASRAAAGWQT